MSDDKKGVGSTVNITSNYQSGGITAHTVNVGSPARHIDNPGAATFRQTLLTLPINKPVIVSHAVGDSEAIHFAHEIRAFMAANGYSFAIEGVPQAIGGGPYKGVVVETNHPATAIIVGGHPG